MEFLKIMFFAWLTVCILAWLVSGSFSFFNLKAAATVLVTERDIKTILKYKTNQLKYNEAVLALVTRNPDIREWEVEMLLLDKEDRI